MKSIILFGAIFGHVQDLFLALCARINLVGLKGLFEVLWVKPGLDICTGSTCYTITPTPLTTLN